MGAWTVGVEGMTCTACAARLERVLERLPGVERATVQFATATARLDLLPDGPTPDRVAAAIRGAGFEVAPADWTFDPARPDAAGRRALFAVVLAAPVVVLAMQHVHGGLSGMVQAALTGAVLVGPARPLLREGWAAARARSGELALLVTLGSLAAVVASLPSLVDPGRGWPVYWESAAGSVALVLVGRALEARARRSAFGAVASLWRAVPTEQTRVDGQRVPLHALRVGDAVLVRAGETVAVDGTVLEGSLSVDRSAWTGELEPVVVPPGGHVRATERVLQGHAVVVARALGRDAEAAKVAQAVLDAQSGRAPSQRMADAWAARLVPTVLGAALVTALVWTALGVPADGVRRALAVLVVACPCALGLATPMALWAVSARAARGGIVVRDPAALERAAEVDTVVLDKTGTLTLGVPVIVGTWGEALPEVAAMASASLHPAARAVAAALGPQLARFDTLEERAGLGVEARLGDTLLRFGASTWTGTSTPSLLAWSEAQRAQGRTVVVASRAGVNACAWALEDALRPGVDHVLSRWVAEGKRLVCLSGDASVAAHARLAGLPLAEIVGDCTPAQKAAWVSAEAARGRTVAMFGDGTNDAEALAAAAVGLAMGAGTSLAQGAASLVLLDASPRVWQRALRLGQAARVAVRRNLAWAAVYNLLAIPIAAGVLVPWGGPDLHPMVASGLMALSSLGVVTATALALNRRGGDEVDVGR